MPIKVLHIEDNPTDAFLLRELVDSREFELAQAGRLSAGLARVEAEKFDIALLDLSLPDSHGIDTFKRFRERAPQVPVIVLSGLDDEASAIATVHCGAQDYICKDELNERLLSRSIHYAIERHRSDRALDAERSLLRALIDSLPDQIYVKDSQSRFITCNMAVARMNGQSSPDKLIGKSDFDFFPQHLAEQFSKEEREVLNGKPQVNREEHVSNGSGGERWMLTTKVPLLGPDGKITGLVGINRDITERKRAEDRTVKLLADLKKSHEDLKSAQLRLIQAEKMESVGRLAAGVAHEVKNPLAVAVMGLEYLKGAMGPENPGVSTIIKEIYDAIKRADTVIGDLLDFSRPRNLAPKADDLNTVIIHALSLVRHELSAKQITVVRRLDEQLPKLSIDSNKIKQVFINLFINAIHAMPPSGTLTVSTLSGKAGVLRSQDVVLYSDKFKAEDYVVVVRVEDTGTGIAPSHLSQIYEPFFTTKTAGHGTGLGLSVTRQIVEMHGGVLDIRNRKEGGVCAIVALLAGNPEFIDSEGAAAAGE
jgi:PAS domain S-box-containing protein